MESQPSCQHIKHHMLQGDTMHYMIGSTDKVKTKAPRSVAKITLRTGIITLVSFIITVVCLDVSIARLRYHYHVQDSIVPMKVSMQTNHTEFHEKVPEDRRSCTNAEDCRKLTCEMNAWTLSSRRQEILFYVREKHALAAYMSTLFDNARNVDQHAKVTDLFERKSCTDIIASSDKTNLIMDLIAFLFACCGLLLTWKSSHLIREALVDIRIV